MRVFYSPTTNDWLKNNIKIYIEKSPTCFGTVTPSSGSALFVLFKFILVRIASYDTWVCDYFVGDVAACLL